MTTRIGNPGAGGKAVKKPKKKMVRASKEDKERYILNVMKPFGSLAFSEFWGIAKDEEVSPFRGASESTFRRAVKALAKQDKVNIIRGPKGAFIVEDPSVTAANAGCDENPPDANGKKPACETTGAVPADSLDSFGKYLVDKAVKEVIKPSERLKTQAEIDAELAPIRERMAVLRRELEKLDCELSDIKRAWEDRHLILTTAPLPEAPEILIVN